MRGKKKTTEQYKLELEEVNKKNGTNIKLRDEYVKDDVKITHICTCGKEWNVAPTTVLQGSAKSCGLCYSLTFEQWCLDNNYQDILNRWDYELNDCKPSEITHRVNKKYYFKCPRGLHESELKIINNFTSRRDGTMDCRKCTSIAQFGIDNVDKNFLEKYWDWKKNNELGIDPWEISYGSKKYVYIYCQEKDYHGSYDIKCYEFAKGFRCGYCHGKKVNPLDSFAQYLLDTFGNNALDMYWDYEKNKNINPWNITKQANKYVYIKCQEKDYHGSYSIQCPNFVSGQRCSYCCPKSGRVHPLDSLGILYPQVLNIWSDKNKKSPYEYTPYANQEVYWKCSKGKHDDYPRKISNSNICDFRCPECSKELKESIMATTLKQVLKHEYLDTIWEYDAGFRTPNNYISRYDIFVPQLDNLLIECQSEYHDDPEQQEIDRLKKQYAVDNGYNYIALDCRDYTPLKAMQIFFPNVKEIPVYVNLLRDTLRDWDLKEAQELLNKGHTYQEVADIVGTTYGAICHNISRSKLIKPENYISTKHICSNKPTVLNKCIMINT